MKVPARKLSIVMVTYNSSDVIRACASSLTRQEFDKDLYEVLVIDNHSTDGTVGIIQEEYPEFTLIVSGSNEGFSVAANRGAKKGTGEYILFLNPDTVLEKDFFRNCCAALDTDPTVGVIGPRLVSQGGMAQPACWKAPSWQTLLAESFLPHQLAARVVTVRPEATSVVHGVTGACLLTRRVVFEKVGGFDERFFLYYEDLDYCTRVEAEGFRIMHLHDLQAVHAGASSSHKDLNMFFRTYYTSRIHFYQNHLSFPLLVGVIVRVGIVLRVGAYFLLGMFSPRFAHLARAHRLALQSLQQYEG